jgi:hypothetical protein
MALLRVVWAALTGIPRAGVSCALKGASGVSETTPLTYGKYMCAREIPVTASEDPLVHSVVLPGARDPQAFPGEAVELEAVRRAAESRI